MDINPEHLQIAKVGCGVYMYLFNFSLSLNTKNTILYICKDFSFAYMALIRLVCITKDISSFYI